MRRINTLMENRTWNAVNKLADELREKKIKIGFFSSTPQGGKCYFFGAVELCSDAFAGGVALVSYF